MGILGKMAFMASVFPLVFSGLGLFHHHSEFRIVDVAWRPDGQFLAMSWFKDRDSYVAIYDSKLNELTRLDNAGIENLDWNIDGTKLATIASGINIYDTTDLANIQIITEIDRDAVTAEADWNPILDQLAVVNDNKVQIWDGTTGQLLNEFSPGTYSLGEVAWNSDGVRLAISAIYPALTIWDTSSSQILSLYDPGFPEHLGGIVAWNLDGTQVALGIDASKIHIWDVATEQVVAILEVDLENDGVRRLEWNENGLLASYAIAIRVWDVENRQTVTSIDSYSSQASWRPNSQEIVIWGLSAPKPEIIKIFD